MFLLNICDFIVILVFQSDHGEMPGAASAYCTLFF